MYTINPTCPLCGLRYADRMLLDLHIREDHVQREPAKEPGDTGPPRQATPRAASPDPAASARPAAQPGLNRVVLALRSFHRETMHASVLLVFRAPPARPQPTMPPEMRATAGDEAPAGRQAPTSEGQLLSAG